MIDRPQVAVDGSISGRAEVPADAPARPPAPGPALPERQTRQPEGAGHREIDHAWQRKSDGPEIQGFGISFLDGLLLRGMKRKHSSLKPEWKRAVPPIDGLQESSPHPARTSLEGI